MALLLPTALLCHYNDLVTQLCGNFKQLPLVGHSKTLLYLKFECQGNIAFICDVDKQ